MQTSVSTSTTHPEFNEEGVEGVYAGWSRKHYIQIGQNVIVRVARTRPEHERNAILWLAGMATRERYPSDWYTEHLGCDRATIRAAFTDPTADVKQLVKRIESFRALSEGKLREPADTAMHRLVKKAGAFAMRKGMLCEVVALTRSGKTETADYLHLTNLHRTVYFVVPATESYSDFIFALGRAMGVNVGGNKTVTQIEAQIRAMFGRGGYDFLIADEGHRLWPPDIKKNPKRIEFLRTLWDENKRTVGILVLSTPQSLISANLATAKTKRWAPGQWEGRVQRFIAENDVTNADMEAVARWHQPDLTDAMVALLVIFGRVSAGFLGSMIKCLERAREEAEIEGKSLRLSHVTEAVRQMTKGTPLQAELAKAGVKL